MKSLRAGRLRSQHLAEHRFAVPVDALAHMLVVQAQNIRGGKWSLGLRSAGTTEAAIEQALGDHSIVRSWLNRGTWHFVHARDFVWLSNLLAPVVFHINQRRYRQLDLDEAVFEKTGPVIAAAIETDGPCTRTQIKRRLDEAGLPAEGQQVPYILQRASLEGLICSGPMKGSEPVFGLVSDWVGEQEPVDREASLSRLAWAYFSSRGPAARQDFMWWSGLPAADVDRAIDSVKGLDAFDVAGVSYFDGGGLRENFPPESAHLLPPFDDYLLGYRDRSAMLAPAHIKVVNGGGGIPKPTLALNGEIVGTWRREVRKGRLVVSISSFRDLDQIEKDMVRASAGRLGDFEEKPVQVDFL